jgi:mannose-P-dolichol utilization defect 1
VAGFALNLVLALQMLYYWNAPASKKSAPVVTKPQKEKLKEIPAAAAGGAQPTPKSKGASTRRRG